MVLTKGRRVILGWAPVPSREETALFLEYMKQEAPDLVGISATTVSIEAATAITNELRAALPSLPIIWGGIAPTIEPELCLQHVAPHQSSRGAVCLGEGEKTMIELCDRLQAGDSYADVSNLWLYRDGRLVRNELRPLVQDLDSLPFPDYSPEHNVLLEADIGRDYDFSLYAYEYDIMTSRGCPFACTFCCNSQIRNLYRGEKYVRRRSVENVIAELAQAKSRYDIRYVRFSDDIFTGDREWLDRFVEPYKREIGLPFWCYTHPKHTSREELALLKTAGVDRITMGIQSGSERVLKKLYGRPGGTEAILKTAWTIAELGIKSDFDMITNNPLEEEEDCRASFGLLMNLPQPVRLNDGVSELSLFPNTLMARRVEEAGKPQDFDMDKFEFWNRMYILTHRTHRFIPRRVLWSLSRSRFFRRHPRFLSIFLVAEHLKGIAHRFKTLKARFFKAHL
jgi:radical SAM superfamily enzyme YgiQ (UPF0313 family)